jgi:hypothetical protein
VPKETKAPHIQDWQFNWSFPGAFNSTSRII